MVVAGQQGGLEHAQGQHHDAPGGAEDGQGRGGLETEQGQQPQGQHQQGAGAHVGVEQGAALAEPEQDAENEGGGAGQAGRDDGDAGKGLLHVAFSFDDYGLLWRRPRPGTKTRPFRLCRRYGPC